MVWLWGKRVGKNILQTIISFISSNTEEHLHLHQTPGSFPPQMYSCAWVAFHKMYLCCCRSSISVDANNERLSETWKLSDFQQKWTIYLWEQGVRSWSQVVPTLQRRHHTASEVEYCLFLRISTHNHRLEFINRKSWCAETIDAILAKKKTRKWNFWGFKFFQYHLNCGM